MSRLDQEPDVIQLASELGVTWQRDPVKNILAYCLTKIQRWVEECGPAATITELERLVCEKLRLVFEEVWTDEDLDRIIHKYIALGESVFATLKTEFDDATFAASRLTPSTGTSPSSTAAVIRGRDAFSLVGTKSPTCSRWLGNWNFPFIGPRTKRRPWNA